MQNSCIYLTDQSMAVVSCKVQDPVVTPNCREIGIQDNVAISRERQSVIDKPRGKIYWTFSRAQSCTENDP